MRNYLSLLSPVVVGGLSLGLLTLAGCDKAREQDAPPPTADGGHDHPSTGPHQGALIELGNEEYHAELVHDDAAGSVTIYLLDSAGKNSVAIDATEVVINLSHDGQAEQFTLAASPDSSDTAGKSSRFISTDTELAEELDHGHEAQLVVKIGGKPFRGEIHHDEAGDER